MLGTQLSQIILWKLFCSVDSKKRAINFGQMQLGMWWAKNNLRKHMPVEHKSTDTNSTFEHRISSLLHFLVEMSSKSTAHLLRGKVYCSKQNSFFGSLFRKKEGINIVSILSGMANSNFCNSVMIGSIQSDDISKFTASDSSRLCFLIFPSPVVATKW